MCQHTTHSAGLFRVLPERSGHFVHVSSHPVMNLVYTVRWILPARLRIALGRLPGGAGPGLSPHPVRIAAISLILWTSSRQANAPRKAERLHRWKGSRFSGCPSSHPLATCGQRTVSPGVYTDQGSCSWLGKDFTRAILSFYTTSRHRFCRIHNWKLFILAERPAKGSMMYDKVRICH